MTAAHTLQMYEWFICRVHCHHKNNGCYHRLYRHEWEYWLLCIMCCLLFAFSSSLIGQLKRDRKQGVGGWHVAKGHGGPSTRALPYVVYIYLEKSFKLVCAVHTRDRLNKPTWTHTCLTDHILQWRTHTGWNWAHCPHTLLDAEPQPLWKKWFFVNRMSCSPLAPFSKHFASKLYVCGCVSVGATTDICITVVLCRAGGDNQHCSVKTTRLIWGRQKRMRDEWKITELFAVLVLN